MWMAFLDVLPMVAFAKPAGDQQHPRTDHLLQLLALLCMHIRIRKL